MMCKNCACKAVCFIRNSYNEVIDEWETHNRDKCTNFKQEPKPELLINGDIQDSKLSSELREYINTRIKDDFTIDRNVSTKELKLLDVANKSLDSETLTTNLDSVLSELKEAGNILVKKNINDIAEETLLYLYNKVISVFGHQFGDKDMLLNLFVDRAADIINTMESKCYLTQYETITGSDDEWVTFFERGYNPPEIVSYDVNGTILTLEINHKEYNRKNNRIVRYNKDNNLIMRRNGLTVYLPDRNAFTYMDLEVMVPYTVKQDEQHFYVELPEGQELSHLHGRFIYKYVNVHDGVVLDNGRTLYINAQTYSDVYLITIPRALYRKYLTNNQLAHGNVSDRLYASSEMHPQWIVTELLSREELVLENIDSKEEN